MKFDTLRLSGFKSFVDPTEMRLEPGLTGVVGPNGCGKSNLLEAMRWVMGEASAKSMRGEGMDDVIFAGAATRPPKNFAEVSLMIANDAGLAPAQFGEPDTLEVSRRITRDIGSAYRVNGKETRARDVRMLFADAASGAQSPALVRQGRIGELIAAKPQGRRRFLEEAAGVSGLYVRRREAELKLKAAEENLLRVDDVLMRLDQQIGSLRRQARQAQRYTTLTEQIEETAALLVWLRYAEADRDALAAQSALDEATRIVAAATTTALEAARKRDETAETLPPLREAAMVAQAVHQRAIAKRDGLDADAERARATLARLDTELARLSGDLEREGELSADATRALEDLEAERRTLEAASTESGLIEAAAAKAATAATAVGEAETALDGLAARAAAASAERAAAERAKREAETALTDAQERREDAAPRLRDLDAKIAEAETALADVRTANETAMAASADAPDRVTDAEANRRRLEEQEAESRKTLAGLRADRDALTSEAEALEKALAAENAGDMGAAIMTRMRAAPGYEAALAAALGEDASAPEHQGFSERARGWLALKLLGSPPAGEPLSNYVDAPEALARRLAVTSVVSRDIGPEAQKDLKPGQHLVSPEGDLWRWDGFFIGAESRGADPAAKRLERLNRLDTVRDELAKAEAALADAVAAQDRLERTLADARLGENNARLDRQAVEDAAATAARRLADVAATLERLRAAQAQLSGEEARQAEAETRAAAALAEADTALSGIGDPTALREQADAARAALGVLRAYHGEAKNEHDELIAAERARAGRLDTIAREIDGWRERAGRAASRAEELRARSEAVQAEHATAKTAPDEIDALRDALVSELTEAEAKVTAANDALAAAERSAREASRADSDANAALSAAREGRARAEAMSESAAARKAETAAALREEAGAEPEEVAARFAELEDEATEHPPVPEVEARLSKLKMDRERLGAVNLRAAIEIEEAETERAALGAERDDLEEAIAKLRKGLAALNREGRGRLLSAFERGEQAFLRLFTHLFGGGEAQLVLTESDDPLEAGLEIMCQPPGKRLQTLSLLSGGEQTLTALALIFAVFLANPAPICVLDEVDAPLDDANVDAVLRPAGRDDTADRRRGS